MVTTLAVFLLVARILKAPELDALQERVRSRRSPKEGRG